jgi:N-acetylneuraminic acid mutarotase
METHRVRLQAGRRMRGVLVSATAALLLAAASAASGQQEPTGSWTPEADGHNFFFGGSASDGTYLYVFGGYQFGEATTEPQIYQQLRRYDPANNSWTTRAQAPTGLFYNAGAYHNGRLFSFGGFDLATGLTNAIHAYSIATNTWTTLGATLSSARYILKAATLGDRIYVTGGYDFDLSASNDEFNPTNNTVASRAPMPGPLYYHAMAAVPAVNKVYVISGFNPEVPTAVNYEYTPATDTWTPRAAIQDGSGVEQPRYGAAAFSVNNRVYITGGNYDNYMNSTSEYNPATDSWAQRANMAFARFLHGSAAIGGKGYVYGGSVGGAFTTGEEFTPPVFNRPPTANAGPDQTVNSSSPDGTTVALDGTASSDPDGDALTFSWTGPFGATSGPTPAVPLPVGTSEITLMVSDPSGESSTDTVSITVVDMSPPTISGVTATPDTLWSPDKKMRQVSISVSASDSSDASPVCEIVSVTSNDAENDGSDWEITGALTLNLRAEKNAGGCARVYTITVRCTDASGNSSTATVTVTVPHSQGNDSSEESAAKKAKK